ncbi:hypothetical protein [Pelosinus sp. IPA-1]|uniref:hypothetical protein n=1 Tax=Pelosinus sp. IPA-1 TaxID=3029569 RepID=UPI0024361A5E|nr:hypothetical protein [Pelosinus sp. IPA-1]GMB00925.1 hypothetical protein PIPA1_37240 [Pelosinus sp. IPA-1]
MANDKQIFGPLELPSGKQIKFREPVGMDRVSVVQMLKMGMDNIGSGAVLVDGYVAVKCITEIDGNEIRDNYKNTYDSMKDEDLSFYQAVYSEMFGMNDDKKEQAKEAAKNLRSGQTSIGSFSAVNTGTQSTTTAG